jgi:hypothetical protein
MNPIEFHYKVYNYFKDKGWKVQLSPYYIDNYTQKPREVDIIAEKFYKIEPPILTRANLKEGLSDQQKYIGTFNVRLYIECKLRKLEEYILFFEKPINKKFEVLLEGRNIFYYETEIPNVEIHYFREDVSKLFPIQSNRHDYLFDAINQSLHSMIYFNTLFKKEGPIISLFSPEELNHLKILAIASFPVVILEDIKAKDINNKPIEDNFVEEVNYAYYDEINRNFKNKIFYIDVVSFAKIDKFLENLDDSAEKIIENVFSTRNFDPPCPRNEKK